MKFDLELLVDNLEQFLKDNLNAKIQEIDDEKNAGLDPADQIITEQVDPEAYIFQSLDNLPVNFDPILFYGISDLSSIAVPGAVAKNPKIEISFIKADDDSKTIGKKLLRYGRALEEIFEKNYFKINNVRPKITISSLQPISFRMQDSDELFKAIGIEIEFSIF